MGFKKVQKEELTAYVIYPDATNPLDWLKIIIRFEHFAYSYIIALKQKDYCSFETKKELRAGYMHEDRVCGYKLFKEDNKTKAQLEIGLQDLYCFSLGESYENFAEFLMELAKTIQEIINHKRK